MSSIAPLDSISDSLDTLSKLIRVLAKEGVTSEHFFLPNNDMIARRRLANYLKAGCPNLYAECPVPHKQNPTAKPKIIDGLLEEVGEPILLPAVPLFVTSEKFVEGATIDGVKIAFLGKNFKRNLLYVREENVRPETVRKRKLLKKASGREVCLACWGHHNHGAIGNANIFLAHVWEFLKKCDRVGECVGEYFFISHGWTVRVNWNAGYGGWCVEARSLSDPNKLDVDRQVVSR